MNFSLELMGFLIKMVSFDMGELMMYGCFNIQSFNFFLKSAETLKYPCLNFTEDHIILFSSIFVANNLVLVSSAFLNNKKPEVILKPSDFIRYLLEDE